MDVSDQSRSHFGLFGADSSPEVNFPEVNVVAVVADVGLSDLSETRERAIDNNNFSTADGTPIANQEHISILSERSEQINALNPLNADQPNLWGSSGRANSECSVRDCRPSPFHSRNGQHQ